MDERNPLPLSRAGPASAATVATTELVQLLQAAHAAAGRPSIRALEASTGVSNSVVSRALSGVRLPRSREALLALADALSADREDLGRRWDAKESAQQVARRQDTARRLAERRPDPCQIDGCPNRAQGALCSNPSAAQEAVRRPDRRPVLPQQPPGNVLCQRLQSALLRSRAVPPALRKIGQEEGGSGSCHGQRNHTRRLEHAFE